MSTLKDWIGGAQNQYNGGFGNAGGSGMGGMQNMGMPYDPTQAANQEWLQ